MAGESLWQRGFDAHIQGFKEHDAPGLSVASQRQRWSWLCGWRWAEKTRPHPGSVLTAAGGMPVPDRLVKGSVCDPRTSHLGKHLKTPLQWPAPTQEVVQFRFPCVPTPATPEETEPLVPPFTIDVLKNVSTEDLAAMRNAPRAVITHMRPDGRLMGHYRIKGDSSVGSIGGNGWSQNIPKEKDGAQKRAVQLASVDVVHQAFKHPANIPPAADYALMHGLAVTEEWCRGWDALRMYLIHPPVSNSND